MVFWLAIIYILICFLHCIFSKRLTIGKKIIWCAVILFLNIFGAIAYILISLSGKNRLIISIVGGLIAVFTFRTFYYDYITLNNGGLWSIKLVESNLSLINITELTDDQQKELKETIVNLKSEFINTRLNINKKLFIIESFESLNNKFIKDGRLTNQDYKNWIEQIKRWKQQGLGSNH